MSTKLNQQADKTSIAAAHQSVHRINHIEHHKTHSSRTLKRIAVKKPGMSPKRYLKAQSVIHAPTVHVSRTTRTARPDRLIRAGRVEQSAFVSHFAKPDTKAFIDINPPLKQIQSVVHKPEISHVQNTEDLFYKAMEKLHDDVTELEQVPARKLHNFTKRLVANRFNKVVLE